MVLTKLLQFGFISLVLWGMLHQQPGNLSNGLGPVSLGTLQQPFLWFVHCTLIVLFLICIFLFYAQRFLRRKFLSFPLGFDKFWGYQFILFQVFRPYQKLVFFMDSFPVLAPFCYMTDAVHSFGSSQLTFSFQLERCQQKIHG